MNSAPATVAIPGYLAGTWKADPVHSRDRLSPALSSDDHPNVHVDPRRSHMPAAQATASKATFSRFHDAVNCQDTKVRGLVRCRPRAPELHLHTKEAGR
jgi:hypothetical protein